MSHHGDVLAGILGAVMNHCRRADAYAPAHRRRRPRMYRVCGAIHFREVLMGRVIVFPLVLRSPDPRGRRARPRRAHMIDLFPLRRQTAFVRCTVDELKALPTQKERNQRMMPSSGRSSSI